MKTATKRKAVASRKIRHRKPQPQRAPQQSIVVRAPDRDWIVSAEEATILKNQVCKNATDAEFQFCMAVARRHKLDPFQKQIHFVPRWDRDAESTDGERGGKVWVPIVGIDGLLHIASRDHQDYGSFSEPEYGPMRELVGVANRGTKYAKPFKIQVPDWCRIEAWKKGATHPTVVKVWWDEIYPDVSFSPTVRKMPRLMLAKCAKAQATRTAYPKTGGLLIPEETQSREFTSFTPEGRVITEVLPAEPANPHLSAYEQREQEGLAKLTKPQREVVEKRMAATTSKQPDQNPVPALFYTPLADGLYRIDGNTDLMKQHREKLTPLWNNERREVLATTQQLGHLIRTFELAKVPFKPLERQAGE